jgi:hypothetical protein
MKFTFILFVAAVSLLLFSCQKEIDWGWDNSGNGNLLVKTVSKTGSDSTVTQYSYDASNRLVKEKMVGIASGFNIGSELIIVRNASGIITQTIQKADALQQIGIDSLITRVNYDPSFSRYRSSVTDMVLFGLTINDSTAYFYDTNVRINSEIRYQSLQGSPFIPSLKTEYTYSPEGDITVLKQFSFDIATFSYNLLSTMNMTYDAGINPLKTNNNDAFVILRATYTSAHNPLQTGFTSPQNPAGDFNLSTAYTYNSSNRPTSSVSTRTPGGAITNTTFYYQ